MEHRKKESLRFRLRPGNIALSIGAIATTWATTDMAERVTERDLPPVDAVAGMYGAVMLFGGLVGRSEGARRDPEMFRRYLIAAAAGLTFVGNIVSMRQGVGPLMEGDVANAAAEFGINVVEAGATATIVAASTEVVPTPASREPRHRAES